MPWKESSVMEERLRFVVRLLDGEGMSDVWRSFGISRKTGDKIFNRYKDHGVEALRDRSRRPVRYANQLPAPVEPMIVRLKKAKPHWGARKIRELLVRRLAGDVRIPANSTVHAVLDRHGLVKRGRQRRRNKAQGDGTPPSLETQSPMVRQFQRRVQAWQPAILLPPDGYRPGLAVHSFVRGPWVYKGSNRLHRLAAPV